MARFFRRFLLNLLRAAKFLAASTFIRKVTPAKAFPGIPVIRHAGEMTVETPELPAMRLYPAGRRLQGVRYRTPRGYGMVMPSVFYDPVQGLVLDRKRRAIEDTNQVPMRKHWYRWRPFLSRTVEEIAGYSFAFRSFGKRYYHFLTDHLPALFMLGELDWSFEERAQLLLAGPLTDMEKYFVPRICPDWVQLREIRTDRLYHLENYLYVSHLSQRSSGCLPDFYLEHFRRVFSPSRPRSSDQRIYISRAKSDRRRISNEDELYAGLRRYGFARYSLEEMSLDEQISLFYDAQFVVSPHGAGLVNLLFSDRAKVLELFAGPLVRPHFYYLCKSLDHEYRYLCSTERSGLIRSFLIDIEEEFNGSFDDFRVDCRAVFNMIEEMLRSGRGRALQPAPNHRIRNTGNSL